MKQTWAACVLWFALCVNPNVACAQELLDILSGELQRNFQTLTARGDPKPYYLSYSVTERTNFVVEASLGSTRIKQNQRVRIFDVSIRVGDPERDNYHRSRQSRARFTSGSQLVLEDEPLAILPVLWRDTDRAYRAATERLNLILSDSEMQVAAEDQSPDFSETDPQVDVQPLLRPTLDLNKWEPKLRKWSALFARQKQILTSATSVNLTIENRYFVDSAGARLRHGQQFVRLDVSAQGKASDGMNLGLSRGATAVSDDQLPSDATVEALIQSVIRDVNALHRAPLAEPYVGPAILSGRAAAVFFHEIFGHRMEGHRQKDEREGRTFTRQVGQPVLPTFLSVHADPTLGYIDSQYLMGRYDYDDEGVKAESVPLVEDGVLRNFMMSRSPIEGFPRSNGHGRKAPGNEVVSRQSNLIVRSTKSVSDAELREALRAELRRQSKSYGLYFDDVTGGLTTTGRAGLQAFTVIPLVVYKIFADGRPDELVRGVDIVGTPLTSFAKIVAAGNQPQVFNGYCGAESGNLPVSAVSPSLLVSEIETQLRAKAQDRPPILPAPDGPGGSE